MVVNIHEQAAQISGIIRITTYRSDNAVVG